MEFILGLAALIGLVYLLIRLRSRSDKATPAGEREAPIPPLSYVPIVLDQFEKTDEFEIGELEMGLARMGYEEEKSLLYALRVSTLAPGIKTMKTLASRWGTAMSGAGGYGLLMGRSSPNHTRVFQFLTEMYLQRFAELSHEIVAKAASSSAERKTMKAKQNAYIRAADRIENARDAFSEIELPGLQEQVSITVRLLNRYAELIEDPSKSLKSPDLLRLLAIQKAKRIHSMHPVFLDVETTGLDEQAEIVEVGVVDSEGSTLLDSLP